MEKERKEVPMFYKNIGTLVVVFGFMAFFAIYYAINPKQISEAPISHEDSAGRLVKNKQAQDSALFSPKSHIFPGKAWVIHGEKE